MSEKDNIREMVMALARGDQEAARASASAVISSKTKRIAESVIVDDEDESNELDEGHGAMRAAHRHARAGGRNYRRKRDMHRDMHRRGDMHEAGYNEMYNRDGYKMHEDGHYYDRNGREMHTDGYKMHEDGHYYNENGYRMRDGGYNGARRDRDDVDADDHAQHARGRRQGRRQDASMKRRRPRQSAMYEKNDTGADSDTVKGKHDHKKMDGDKPNAIKDKGKVAPSSKTYEEE